MGFKTSQNTSDLSEQWSPLVMAFFKLEKQRATWDFFISYFFLQNKRQTKQKHFQGRDWAKKLRINMSPWRDFPLLLSPPKKTPTTIKLCVFIHLNFFSSMFCLKKLQRKGKRGKKKGIGDKKGRGKSHPKALRDIHVLFSEECIQRSFVEFLTLILLANSGICVAELLSFLQDCYKTQAMAVLRIEQL